MRHANSSTTTRSDANHCNNHCNNDEQDVALTSAAHGRNCNILLHMRERCAHRRCSESCSPPGRHNNDASLVDTHCYGFERFRHRSIALECISKTASKQLRKYISQGSLGRNSPCNVPTIASNVSECRLATEYSASTLDSTTELRMIDVTLTSTIALSGESNTVAMIVPTLRSYLLPVLET
jgi:hypothetical protein